MRGRSAGHYPGPAVPAGSAYAVLDLPAVSGAVHRLRNAAVDGIGGDGRDHAGPLSQAAPRDDPDAVFGDRERRLPADRDLLPRGWGIAGVSRTPLEPLGVCGAPRDGRGRRNNRADRLQSLMVA